MFISSNWMTIIAIQFVLSRSKQIHISQKPVEQIHKLLCWQKASQCPYPPGGSKMPKLSITALLCGMYKLWLSTIRLQKWLVILQCFVACSSTSNSCGKRVIFSIWETSSEGNSQYIYPLRVIVSSLGNFHGYLLTGGLPLSLAQRICTYTCVNYFWELT